MASLEHPVAPAGSKPAEAPPLPPPPRVGRKRLIAYLVGVAVLALCVYSWTNVQGSVGALVNGFFNKKGLIRDFFPHSIPPNLHDVWPGVQAAVTTLCIAILSIAFGIIGAIAALPFAARNITPSRPVYEVTRFVMAILRAIPELIMLLFFLITVGIGPWSATVALTFHGIGVKGKLFAEAVEEMDMTPVDALRVAGAGRLQVFRYAVLPGVRNTLLGLTMYRLDANFRSAVTLGAVGGGGIGFLIDNDLGVFQLKAVLTFVLILVVFVLAIERVSSIVRARLAR